MAIQIANNDKSSYISRMDYVRQISADGMWERSFDPLTLDQCTGWNSHHPSYRTLENPLTGWGDLDRYPGDYDGDGEINQDEQRIIRADFNSTGSVMEYKMFSTGNPRQLFTLSGNSKIGISTNPPSSNRMSMAGKNTVLSSTSNVRTIFLNGIEIEILEMAIDGTIKLNIQFDKVAVDNDVRWCGSSIVLNPIKTAPQYSLVIKTGNTLHLDQGTAATEMDLSILFEGENIFTKSSNFSVEDGAHINVENGAEMIIDRNSSMNLRAGGLLNIENGGVVRVRRGGILNLETNSVLNLEAGARLIIEDSSFPFDRGKLVFEEDARINLAANSSIIEVNGLIEIGDDATFRLSTIADPFRTSGKIHFKQNPDCEIISGSNSGFEVFGFSSVNEVIINDNTVFTFPSNLADFTIKDLRISQGYADRIEPPKSNTCHILFDNINFSNKTGSFDSYGVQTFGQKNMLFDNCAFNNLWRGINAENSVLGYNLIVYNSSFSNCRYAINTYGEGATLRNIDILYCYSGWFALNMSAPSIISKSSTQFNTTTNIHYTGTSTLYVSDCVLDDGQIGLYLQQATAKVSCTRIKDQTDYAVFQDQGASLVMDDAYGLNDLRGNQRTINTFNANIFDLHNGENDLRPTVNGSANVVNGNFVCGASATIIANRNKWNNSGTAPTPSDYSLNLNCSPFPPVMILDSSPLALSHLIECNDERKDDNINDGNYLVSDSLFYLNYSSIIETLNSTRLNSFLTDQELDDYSFPWTSNEEYSSAELEGFQQLLDLLSNPNIFIESTNYLYYLEALNELHSSFLELHLLYDYEILSNIQINQINEDYLVHLEQTSFTLEQSELNDELFYFLLKRSDYYRVVNDYDLAFSTLDLSLLQASSPEQTLLAQTQACLLEEEQYSIQQFGIFDFLNFENACDYTEFPAEFVGNNNGPISIELILTPNPAVEFLNISFGLESNLELQHVFVYDLSGRVLLELNGVSNISTSLDISSLSTGIYVLSAVSTNGLTKSQKFVKYD